MPLEEKEYAIEISNMQMIEAKRNAIAKRAKVAKANYKKKKSGSVQDLVNDLENN